MYGRFEGPNRIVFPAGAEQVALINRMMSARVTRFIYSTAENFFWQKHDGKIGGKRDMFETAHEYQAQKAAKAAQLEHAPTPAERGTAEANASR